MALVDHPQDEVPCGALVKPPTGPKGSRDMCSKHAQQFRKVYPELCLHNEQTYCTVPLPDGTLCGEPSRIRAGRPYKNAYGLRPASEYNLCEDHLQRKDPPRLSVPDGNINWIEDILPVARKVVESYRGTGVTKRQLHYRLASDPEMKAAGYANTGAVYKAMCHRTALARRAGQFPATLDRTRNLYARPYVDGIEDAIAQMVKGYGIDRTQGQRQSVYLISEKAGLLAQFQQWFNRYGINTAALNGYSSQSFVEKVSEDIEADGRSAVLLYVGDFDCEGVDIDRDFVKRCNEWTRDRSAEIEDDDEYEPEESEYLQDTESEGACWSKVRRVALSQNQIEQHGLLQSIGKLKSKRMPKFKAKYGTTMQVEVDALPPDVLRALIQTELDDLVDVETYQEVRDREDTEREVLSRLNRIDLERSTAWLAPGAKAYNT